jgi:large subunit ribosomal protein L29
MKPAEIRDLSDEDLAQQVKDSRSELFNLRFQLATGQLDNTNRISAVKKDIARLHTELCSRELRAGRDVAAS